MLTGTRECGTTITTATTTRTTATSADTLAHRRVHHFGCVSASDPPPAAAVVASSSTCWTGGSSGTTRAVSLDGASDGGGVDSSRTRSSDETSPAIVTGQCSSTSGSELRRVSGTSDSGRSRAAGIVAPPTRTGNHPEVGATEGVLDLHPNEACRVVDPPFAFRVRRINPAPTDDHKRAWTQSSVPVRTSTKSRPGAMPSTS